MGLGEVGDDAQHLQPAWMSAGMVGAQHLPTLALSIARLEGATSDYGGAQVPANPTELQTPR